MNVTNANIDMSEALGFHAGREGKGPTDARSYPGIPVNFLIGTNEMAPFMNSVSGHVDKGVAGCIVNKRSRSPRLPAGPDPTTAT